MINSPSTHPVRIGARMSPLARAQASQVAALLADQGVPSSFVGITTKGDTDRRKLAEIGGTGVFVSAVRDALADGSIDVAVHSLKDLPTAAADGLRVAAIPVREDTRDVLVGLELSQLRDGIRIGTGAPRRVLQLLAYAKAHDLQIDVVPIRGNVDTRIDLVRHGTVDAVVLAAAGLRRLGHLSGPIDGATDVIIGGLPSELLSLEVMLPAPGQGALALEISTSLSNRIVEPIESLEDQVARAETLAEREFLATLEAGCTSPVGARAIVKSVRGTSLDLTLAAVIGRTLGDNFEQTADFHSIISVKTSGSLADPRVLGADLARQVLLELFDPGTSGH